MTFTCGSVLGMQIPLLLLQNQTPEGWGGCLIGMPISLEPNALGGVGGSSVTI